MSKPLNHYKYQLLLIPTKVVTMTTLLSLAFVGFLVKLAAGASYTVGGNGGWSTGTDLQTWVQSQTFSVGDNLVFQYGPPHSVLEVTKADYDSCQTSNPLQVNSDGNTIILLSSAGKRYFICGVGGHCNQGMKLEVDTPATSTPPPTTAPVNPTPKPPPPTTSISPATPPSPKLPSSKAPSPKPAPSETPNVSPSISPTSNSPVTPDGTNTSPVIAPSSFISPPPSPSSANNLHMKLTGLSFGMAVLMALLLFDTVEYVV